jgi:solute carrier family 34 (sodium-dependent phosphate cotransporter)
MENSVEEPEEIKLPGIHWSVVFKNTAYILAALFIFLFALDLMIASLEFVGKTVAETIILATSNPFTGLFIGLLVTAIIQSSSAATSIVVALTASGAITLEGAVPVIMGANIGTTITSTLVSLSFITKKKEFRRAVAAGSYHSFFNILTAVILFPLEYYYGFLSKASQYLASTFFGEPAGPIRNDFSLLGSGFKPVIDFLINNIHQGFVLIAVSVILIFGSILFFRKVLSKVLGVGSPERFQQFFFRGPLQSLTWGVLTTAAIRSSTVTTSLVVPLVAKKIIKLKSAIPFILGANVGTTITAFIAAVFNSNAAISIAIAHFLFNFIGALVFFLIPWVKDVPVTLAMGLGSLTRKYRLIGFLYLLMTFFFIPFSLIYFNRSNIVVQELTYEKRNFQTGEKATSSVIAKTIRSQDIESWHSADAKAMRGGTVENITSNFRKNNLFQTRDQLFEFNAPGFCWQGADSSGNYTLCVREFLPHLNWRGSIALDSVYVFEKQPVVPDADSSSVWYVIAARQNILIKMERKSKTGKILTSEDLTSLETR